MESSYTNNGTIVKESLYKAMWRWHFYAGIIFAPFLIMLAITGAIYLFKPQIESFLYKDYYYIAQGKHELSPSELIEKVTDHYPNAVITRYRPSDAPNRSTEVGIVQDDEEYTVFINPYNGQLIGKLKVESKFMNVIVKIHGEFDIAKERNVHPGFEVNFPEGEKGVYTVSVFPTLPQDQATLHIDQYSGKVLADLRFKDYGWMAKMIEIGIALHEGRYFGLINQMIGLITCLGLVMIAYSGVVMWWKRRPQRKLGTPPLPENKKTIRIVAAIMVVFGVMMPLVGLSLIFVFLVDWLIVKRIPKLQLWLS